MPDSLVTGILVLYASLAGVGLTYPLNRLTRKDELALQETQDKAQRRKEEVNRLLRDVDAFVETITNIAASIQAHRGPVQLTGSKEVITEMHVSYSRSASSLLALENNDGKLSAAAGEVIRVMRDAINAADQGNETVHPVAMLHKALGSFKGELMTLRSEL